MSSVRHLFKGPPWLDQRGKLDIMENLVKKVKPNFGQTKAMDKWLIVVGLMRFEISGKRQHKY